MSESYRPGSETDLAIAERMDFEKQGIVNGQCRVAKDIINNWFEDQRPFQPSTNDADALQAMLHFAAWPTGEWVELSIDHDSMHEEGGYQIKTSDPRSGWLSNSTIETRSETFCGAVCKAFLQWPIPKGKRFP